MYKSNNKRILFTILAIALFTIATFVMSDIGYASNDSSDSMPVVSDTQHEEDLTNDADEPEKVNQLVDAGKLNTANQLDEDGVVEEEVTQDVDTPADSEENATVDSIDETVEFKDEELSLHEKEDINKISSLLVDSPVIAAGEKQNIAIVFKYNISEGSLYKLTLKNGLNEDVKVIDQSKVEDNIVVFSFTPGADDLGEFTIEDLSLVEDGQSINIALASDDTQQAAGFKVISCEAQDNGVENVTIVDVTENNEIKVEDVNVNEMIVEEKPQLRAQAPMLFALKAPFTRSVRSNNRPVVCIDAGHGGNDSGACRNGLKEKDLTLKIAKYCQQELESLGYKVVMTRTQDNYVKSTDVKVELEARAELAKQNNADFFISIHINAGGGSGVEVWVPNDSSYLEEQTKVPARDLGNKVLAKLVDLGFSNRGLKWDEYTANGGRYYSDGSYADSFAVIRHSRTRGIPAILVEHGFIDNAHDVQLLKNESMLKKMGIADAQAIHSKFQYRKLTWDLEGDGIIAPGSVTVGDTITIKPSVKGNLSDYTYNYCFSENGKWGDSFTSTMLGDNPATSNTSGSIKATKSGFYKCWINVYDKDGNTLQSQTAKVIVDKPDLSWSLNDGGIQAPSSVNVGETITIKPSIKGSTDGLTYNYCFSENGKWGDSFTSTMKDGSSATSSTSGSIRAAKPGYYVCWLNVYDRYGNTKQARGVRVKVSKSWDLIDGGIDAPSSVKFGDVITIKPKVSVNANGFTYNYCFSANGKWGDSFTSTMKGGKSATSSLSGKCVAKEPGYYICWINVYDRFGNTIQSVGKKVMVSATDTLIMGTDDVSVDKMIKFYKKYGSYPSSDLSKFECGSIEEFCNLVQKEASAEGVKPSVLFVQSMLESGYLQSTYARKQANFGGLGVTSAGAEGEKFTTVQEGLRAQTQHLKAYADTKPLNNTCVDRRFGYVSRGVAKHVSELSGKWAADPNYGYKLNKMLEELSNL